MEIETLPTQNMDIDKSFKLKNINYEELIQKQPNEIIFILVEKINSQQNEISGLWNKIRKSKKNK